MKIRYTLWRVLAAMVLVSLVVSACGGGAGSEGGESSDGSFKAAIVTDTAGLGDQSFNDSANRGLEQAKSELGIETQVYETAQPSDYEPSLAQAPAQGSDITFAIGFLMTDALTNVAPQNANTKYGIIDSVVEADNVASLLFKEEEGSFLVGVVAGLMTESNKVGFIGGLEVAAQEKGAGFWAIGVDSDQYDLAPENILTSMMKQVDVAVYETIKAAQEGNFQAGTTVFGLKEGGVGLAPTTSNNTPQEVIDAANGFADRIIAGEFTVPTTEDELAGFTPPQ